MVNLNHLKYFYLCAQNESITKTAQLIGITQPALSIQINSFEENLGFRLFARTKKKLNLTPRGIELYKYAARLFEVSDEIDRFVKNLETVNELRLNLGVSDEVERPFVADVAGKLLKISQGKKLSIQIISKSHAEIGDLLEANDVELIITNKEIRANLKLVARLDIPVLLISTVASVENQHALGPGQAKLLLESLGQPLIVPTEDLVLGSETKKFLKRMQMDPPVAISSNIVSCLVRSVQEGAGAAFLPIAYIAKELKKGSLKAYGPSQGLWCHSIFLYTLKTSQSDLSQALGKIMLDLSLLQH